MAKENCTYCKHCKFTSVPEWYRGRGGWCKETGKTVNPMARKLFCRRFERRAEDGKGKAAD